MSAYTSHQSSFSVNTVAEAQDCFSRPYSLTVFWKFVNIQAGNSLKPGVLALFFILCIIAT